MYWSLTPEGATVLRKSILENFKNLTTFARQLHSPKIVIQTVSRFLRGERLTQELAQAIITAVITDADTFCDKYVHLIPIGHFDPQVNQPDVSDLLLEALTRMSASEQTEFLHECYLITKNNG